MFEAFCGAKRTWNGSFLSKVSSDCVAKTGCVFGVGFVFLEMSLVFPQEFSQALTAVIIMVSWDKCKRFLGVFFEFNFCPY